MRALAFKDHWNISCNAAYMAQQHVDYLVAKGELQHRVEIYGGTGTCFGMNPQAVRIALQYPNIKDDLVSDLHLVGFLAGRGPAGERRSPPGE